MLRPLLLEKYVGFLPAEVDALCEKFEMDRTEAAQWSSLLQEAMEKAASIAKASLQIFIVFIEYDYMFCNVLL